MRLRVMGLVAAACAALLAITATAAHADHSWGSYHWKRSGVLMLSIYSSVTPDWSNALVVADSDWNRSTVLENTLVASDSAKKTRRQCPRPTGAIRVCNDSYGYNGWAGIASIGLADGHISGAIAKMNDSYLGNASSDKRQGVMCQEVGHDFGLDHQDENFTNANLGTCMDYTNDWSTNQHPNAHDYEQLELIYSHADSAQAEAGKTKIKTGDTVTMVTWNE